MAALLSLDGSPLVGGGSTLSFKVISKADQALTLVGNWQAVFAVLTGEARAPRGALEIAGHDGRDLVLKLELGVLRAQTEWPLSRTVREVLELSTRLLGRSPAESRVLAHEALSHLGLGFLEKVRVDRLRRVDLRLLGLAHALLGAPPVLALENPFWGLDASERETLAKAIGLARVDRKLIVSVPDSGADGFEQSLIRGAEEILVLQEGVLRWQGAPGALSGAHRLYLVTLSGELEQVADELGRLGIVVRSMTASAPHAPRAGAGRLVVELPSDGSTRVLLEAVQARAATLLELRQIDNVR